MYINYEHCSSFEQLRGYFNENITSDSDTYADLLDYGRRGEIAEFLRHIGELDIALRVESIPSEGIRNHEFYNKLKEAITGEKSNDNVDLIPSFDKCFRFEGVRCETADNGVKVYIRLCVLMRVNEVYELSITSNWGIRDESVNPSSYVEGRTEEIEIFSAKKPGKDIGKITIKAGDKELATVCDISNDTFSSDQEKPCENHSESESAPVIVIQETIYDEEEHDDDDDYDDDDDEVKILGIRLTMVSNKGKVLYTHDNLLHSDRDYFIKNGALYICSVPGSDYYEQIDVDWIKIDKKGNFSKISAEQLPVDKDGWNFSIKERVFSQSHPHFSTQGLGTIDGKWIFSALPCTEEDGSWYVDYDSKSSTIYDEDFNRIMSIRAGYEPVKVFQSWYFLVKKGERYGIIDKNHNVIIPCEYKNEIYELSEGVFRVFKKGSDEDVYVAKEQKWYNSDDYYIYDGEYLQKKNNAGMYQLINIKSGKVIIESERCFGTGPVFSEGFSYFSGDNSDGPFSFLCHGDSYIKIDDYETVESFKDSGDYIGEGRIITLLYDRDNKEEVLWRIRDYSGKIIKELDPSYQFRRGYKHGKALFIKESSRCRRVGYVDLSGKVTLLPFEIPLKRGFDEDEWVEIIDVDCEFVSRDSILIKNDYNQYLVDVNGSIIDEDYYIEVLADDLLGITRKNRWTLCNGQGEVLYSVLYSGGLFTIDDMVHALVLK